MKIKRPNTPETLVTNMDTTDTDKMKASLSVNVGKWFEPSCQFCKQSLLHPSLQGSDWSNEDWTGGHTKAHRANRLLDWDLPPNQSNPNSKLEVDKINMDKLTLDYDNPQEEQIQVTNSLIPPPALDKQEKITTQEMPDVGTNSYQQEEEEYEPQWKIYVGQFSNEDSNTSSDL